MPSDADDTRNCTIDLSCDKLVNRALRLTPSSRIVQILPILLILLTIATRSHITHMPWIVATDASKGHSSWDDHSTLRSIELWRKRFSSFDERMDTAHMILSLSLLILARRPRHLADGGRPQGSRFQFRLLVVQH